MQRAFHTALTVAEILVFAAAIAVLVIAARIIL